MKIALYRKYRPKSFTELLGQDHITKTLKNAIKDDKTSHAYIFTGPRGTGKTSAARLLATAINCTKIVEAEPCGKCESCVSIFGNKAIDIIEIDAASNRGIDEIRELKENVKFGPSNLGSKVFIIDEVHMLTKEAFNALLKTLEEPPKHTVFILATTEIHKVPKTILSRCQRFDFKRINLNSLLQRLEEIAKKEGIKIKKEALNIIAESSDGGFRDAISYLDQISSYKDEEIDEADITDLFGMSDYKSLADFTLYLKNKKIKEAIELVNNLVENGVDVAQFTKNIIESLRKLMLFTVLGKNHIEIAEDHLKNMEELSKNLSAGDIAGFIEVILKNSNEFRNAPLPQLPLEISIVEICGEDIDSSLSRQISQNNKAEIESENKEKGDISVSTKMAEGLNPQIDETNPERAILGREMTPESNDSHVRPDSHSKKTKMTKKNTEGPHDSFSDENWKDFLLELKSKNVTIHALVKNCRYEILSETLTLYFSFRFHKERIEEKRNKKVIEDIILSVYNKAYEIKCVVENKGENNASFPENNKEKKRVSNENEKQNDLYASALEIFGE